MEAPKDLTINFIFMVVLCLVSVLVDIVETINSIKTIMIHVRELKKLALEMIKFEKDVKEEFTVIWKRVKDSICKRYCR